MLEKLFTLSENVIQNSNFENKRYIYDKIDWNQKLFFLTGFRGSGKTTVLLQNLKKIEPKNRLYITGDSVEVGGYGLFETAMDFSNMGGEYLVIDEVHMYSNWIQEVKNVYDLIPGLKVFASGSSGISITKGQYDLSRRSVVYELEGLSFREYLNFKYNLELPVVSFEEVLENGLNRSKDILNILKSNNLSVLVEFQNYLESGFYPYFLENENLYLNKLQNSLSKVIYEDIFMSFNLSNISIIYLKKMIALIANSMPFTPNIDSLSSSLGISKETVYNYLHYLDQSNIFISLKDNSKGLRFVRKPNKIYLENTNLYYALSSEVQIGSVREAFFVNQLKGQGLEIYTHKKVDFLVNGKAFEIGGKNKLNSKNKYEKNTYFVVDQVESAGLRFYPLWLFGFGY